jgi:hypothetical protein
MRKDGTWAGQMELQALAAARRCGVCIHQAGAPPWLIEAPVAVDADEAVPPTEGGPYLHISYEGGEHYNSVRPLQGDDPSGPGGPRPLPAACAALPAAAPPPETERDAAAVDAVLRSTGGRCRARAARVLAEMDGDVGAAIEALIAASLLPEAEAVADADAPADAAALPSPAAPAPAAEPAAPPGGWQQTRAAKKEAKAAAKATKKAGKAAAAAPPTAPLAALRL